VTRLERSLLGLVAVLFLGCPGKSPKPSPTAPPRASVPGNGHNVLLITIDTLRADHLGTYGYSRDTSPQMDALGQAGTVFEQAYTFWPKTRGSFVAMMTGRQPCRSGYSKTHPVILDFNATLASVLQDAGYATSAVVDNSNVAKSLGFGKGFESYREIWEDKSLKDEMAGTRAITEAGLARFKTPADAGRPWFLWLHYVNPHTPYTPPAPFDTKFLDGSEKRSPRLSVVKSFHGGLPKQWAHPGQDRLGYYVAQYDGEIAAVDQEIGRLWGALREQGLLQKTVVMLTSDHGESLGEHDYYFDHGENLFDPSLKIPLLVVAPGGAAARRSPAFASTLDIVPTLLDAVKVSYPPDLAGHSLLAEVTSGTATARDHLFAQNDRNLTATFDRSYKLVASPRDAGGADLALFDRQADPGEKRDVARLRQEPFRASRRELEMFQERCDREWSHTRILVQGKPGEGTMSPEACERLRALGYTGVAGCGF
jgi:arylsulfatase A-like enzyme